MESPCRHSWQAERCTLMASRRWGYPGRALFADQRANIVFGLAGVGFHGGLVFTKSVNS